jgi:hypothetical protein
MNLTSKNAVTLNLFFLLKKNSIRLTLITLISIFAITSDGQAQCGNDNSQYGTSTAPDVLNTPIVLSTCMYGGEYRLVNSLLAGNTYSFETCGDTDFDSQITLYDNITGAVVG